MHSQLCRGRPRTESRRFLGVHRRTGRQNPLHRLEMPMLAGGIEGRHAIEGRLVDVDPRRGNQQFDHLQPSLLAGEIKGGGPLGLHPIEIRSGVSQEELDDFHVAKEAGAQEGRTTVDVVLPVHINGIVGNGRENGSHGGVVPLVGGSHRPKGKGLIISWVPGGLRISRRRRE